MKPLISFLTEREMEVLYHFSYQFLVFYPSLITHHASLFTVFDFGR